MSCPGIAKRRAREMTIAPVASLFLTLLLSLVASPGRAADSLLTPELTLDQAIRRAVERAPMLDARRAQTLAAQQEARRAAALPDPKLSLGIQDLPVTGAEAFNPSVDNFTMKKIGVTQECSSMWASRRFWHWAGRTR